MAKLTINIGARIDGLKKGLATAQGKIKSWSRKMGKHAKVALGVGLAGLGVGLGAMVKHAVKLAAAFERMKVAFTTMTGSASKAKDLISELNEFSKSTPFSPEQVMKAGRTLLAFGFEAKNVSKTLRILGDVSAGTGKDLSEMAVIFGQIKGAGRLMGQDLLQLINAGFNPLQTMAEKTGKSMSQLKDEMSKGAISFQMVEQAFKDATGEGGKFFNMMEEQSQTLSGQLSTLEGNVNDLMRQFGELALPELKLVVLGLGEAVKGLQELAIARAALESGGVDTELSMGEEIATHAGINGLEMAAKFFLPFDNKISELAQKLRDEFEAAGTVSTKDTTSADVKAKRDATAREAAEEKAKKDSEKLAEDLKIESAQAKESEDLASFMSDLEASDGFDMLDDLAKGDATIAADKKQAAEDEAKKQADAAKKFEANMTKAFQPGGRIQSRLARIGGDRTIDISGQVAQQQLNVQKQILAVNERVAMAVEDYDGPTFPVR